MDAVIPYVSMEDVNWVNLYMDYSQYPILEHRFRDWGFLKYVMRGIETYMPFINRIHLVVMMDSQVPEWINRDKVNIVYHEDIIPKKFLPLFNSATIEMFIHKIPGLSEEFIYFNDDIFPTTHMEYSDFFDGNGNVYNNFQDIKIKPSYFLTLLKKSARIAASNYGIIVNDGYFNFPQHIMSPFIKSKIKECFNHTKSVIYNSISREREPYNLTQVFFTNDLFYGGKMKIKKIPHIVLFTNSATLLEIKNAFLNENLKCVCINDWGNQEKISFENYKQGICEILELKYKIKSQYEL